MRSSTRWSWEPTMDATILAGRAGQWYSPLLSGYSRFRLPNQNTALLRYFRWQEGLTAFITKPEVEKKNVQRVILKARREDCQVTLAFKVGQKNKKIRFIAGLLGTFEIRNGTDELEITWIPWMQAMSRMINQDLLLSYCLCFLADGFWRDSW